MLGVRLWAVIVGRLKLPCGGRGTDRGEVEGMLPADLAPGPLEGPASDLAPLCGGRGTKRPAGAGRDATLFGRTSGVRLVGIAVLRTAEASGPREAGCVAGRAELAGGVILLTVGREAAARDGRAFVFGPSMAPRAGDTSGLPMAEIFRKAPGETLAAFCATGSPRSSVFRGTAVKAPGLLA